jgi:tetratricopeptide (TPR) repeat protein
VLIVSIGAAIVSVSWALRARTAETRATGLFGTLLDRSLASVFDHAAEVNELAGGAPVARRMLDAALADLAALREQAAGDARVAAELAEARLRLGDVLGNPTWPNLGDRAAASAEYRGALADAETLAAGPQAGEARRVAALARRRLGQMAFFENRQDEAVSLLEQSLDELAALAAAVPEDAELRHHVAAGQDALVAPLARVQRADDAQRRAHEAIDGFLALAAQGEDPSAHRFQAAAARLNLAGLHYGAGRHAEALAEYEAARDELAPLAAAAPDDIPCRDKLGWSRTWIGITLQAQGRLPEARDALAGALDDYRDLAADDAGNPQHALRIAHVAFSLGQVSRDLAGEDPERLRACLALFDETLAALERANAAGRLTGSWAALPDRVRAERGGVAARLPP